VFDDRFLSVDALSDLLAETDVFLTPYASREQIASGALTFALAAGCAIVSTPYWYAQDMLGSGAGQLVPFGDSGALAEAVCHYIDQPDRLADSRTEARRIGATLGWPAVAKSTASVLQEARALAPRRRPAGIADLHLASLRTDHLRTLIDDVGIVQHADGIVPRRDSGYCVDDVARLAVVSLALADRSDEQFWTANLYRALAFLHAATDEHGMRNFMGYDRRWLDEPHRGDHVGRAIWALGDILATAWIPAVVRPAGDLLDRLVKTLEGDVTPRTAAYAVLGLSRLDSDRLAPGAQALLERLVERLAAAYTDTASSDWSWFEEKLTYDNARLSQALLTGANALGRADLAELGLDSLRWLGDECGLDGDMLRLPGHLGRRRGEDAPGDGDEQPLDAAALVEAELSASSSPARPTTVAGRSRRSIGSSAVTGWGGRCTTSQPAAAATASERRRSTTTKAQNRPWPSTKLPSCSTPPAFVPGSLTERRNRCWGEHGRALRAPPREPDPHRRRLAGPGERRVQPRRRAG
jgi:hypothetical protein